MGSSVKLTFLEMFRDDWFLLSDFTDFFCGDFLGEGNSRRVYEFRLDPKFVIKIDKSGQFDNVSEWDLYHNVKDHHPEYAHFFADCHRISSCGRILLQRKTTPIKAAELPNEIPDFFSDTKLQNWGRMGKRVVCHDYANHKVYSKKVSLMKPKWWSDSFQGINL